MLPVIAPKWKRERIAGARSYKWKICVIVSPPRTMTAEVSTVQFDGKNNAALRPAACRFIAFISIIPKS